MKNIFILFLSFPLLFAACKKDDRCPFTESTASASAEERTYLRNYIAANTLTAIEHSSGVFYNITAPGTGGNPDICSNITVRYTGSVIPSGNVFDATPASSPGVTFGLGELIAGWQKVLPLVKSGGRITLYIPPSLGYGAREIPGPNNTVLIPANSYLKFELELVNVL